MRSNRRSPTRAVTSLVAAVLLAGCVLPGNDEVDDAGGLDRSLAATPEELADTSTTAATTADEQPTSTTSAPSASSASGVADGPTTSVTSTTGPSSPTAEPAAETRILVDEADPAGDTGATAPDWSDVVHLTVAALPTAELRAEIVVDGTVPRELGDREVAGIGLDLYLTGGRESDYQIFIEGGADGWFAYLDGPRGLVAFPGQFRMGTDRFVVVVPRDAVGGDVPGELRLFADWSDADLGLVATSSTDAVPDQGRRTYG